MKPEFISSNGTFFALAPKSYHLTEYENGEAKVKQGAKGNFFVLLFIGYIIGFWLETKNIIPGVPRSVKLTEAAFRSSLFEGTPFDVPVNNLVLNANRQMTRISMYKRGLSDACTKIHVHPDKVTCTPLQKYGKNI